MYLNICSHMFNKCIFLVSNVQKLFGCVALSLPCHTNPPLHGGERRLRTNIFVGSHSTAGFHRLGASIIAGKWGHAEVRTTEQYTGCTLGMWLSSNTVLPKVCGSLSVAAGLKYKELQMLVSGVYSFCY